MQFKPVQHVQHFVQLSQLVDEKIRDACSTVVQEGVQHHGGICENNLQLFQLKKKTEKNRKYKKGCSSTMVEFVKIICFN